LGPIGEIGPGRLMTALLDRPFETRCCDWPTQIAIMLLSSADGMSGSHSGLLRRFYIVIGYLDLCCLGWYWSERGSTRLRRSLKDFNIVWVQMWLLRTPEALDSSIKLAFLRWEVTCATWVR